MWGPKLQQVIRKQEAATVAAVVVIGLFAAYNWAVSPHIAALHASQQYQRVAARCVKKSEDVNHRLRAERARLQKLTGENVSLAQMVFTPAQADEFLSDFEAFCKETGCTVGSLSYLNDKNASKRGVEEAASSITTKSAALMVYGSYGSITRFIEKLGSRSQKVWIDALRMMVSDSSPNGVACQLVVTIYVRNDREGVGHEQARTSN